MRPESKYLPYFRYYKTVLYLFLRLFGHSSRPRTLFFLASLELLVRLLFKGVLYSRASYNSGNTVITCPLAVKSLKYSKLASKKLASTFLGSKLQERPVSCSYMHFLFRNGLHRLNFKKVKILIT